MILKLVKPFEGSALITQRFGDNPADYPWTEGHNGVDYGVWNGRTLLAPHDGEVIHFSDPGGYGINVEIWNPDLGVYGILAHGQPDSYLTPNHKWVAQGTPVMVSNNTGRSTGPHLHWSQRHIDQRAPSLRGPMRYGWFDPLPHLVGATAPVDPIKHLYDQKQKVEWAVQELLDVTLAAHYQQIFTTADREKIENVRVEIERLRGNLP